MTHLLRVDASITRESSVSRSVADTFQRTWQSARPDDDITVHQLEAEPLPYLTLDHVMASMTPAEQRTSEQRDALRPGSAIVDDVTAADVLLLAVPLYNWGTPALFKSWIDHLLNEPRAAGAERPFAGKQAVLVSARGGCYRPGTPREGWDHVVPYLEHVLGDSLGLELSTILVEFTLVGVSPALAGFEAQAKESLEQAHETARRLAEQLAGRPAPVA